MSEHRHFPLTPQLNTKYQSPSLASEGCNRGHSPDSQFDSFPVSPDVLSTLSNNELHELVHHHQKFLKSIKMLIQTSEKEINENCVPYAIEVLKIAQKILEYAAGCGKNLQKKMILNVLHDLACAYQKTWDLQQCCNYLEALLFNMNKKFGFDSSNSSKISVQKSKLNHSKSQESGPNTYQDSQFCLEGSELQRSVSNSIRMGERVRNIKYNLQYAAINSQLKNHEKSCQYGDKAIQLTKQLFSSIDSYLGTREKQRNHISSKIGNEIFSNSLDIISSVCNSNYPIKVKFYDSYIQICSFLMKGWGKAAERNQQPFTIYEHQKQLKNFTIGFVMQMKTYEQQIRQTELSQHKNFDYEFSTSCPDLMQICSSQRIIKYILLLCIAFFTKATELRLKSKTSRNKFQGRDHILKEQIVSVNEEFVESEIFHLLSIIVYFIYIPIRLELINHIMQSYMREYKNSKLDVQNYFDTNNNNNPGNKGGQILIDKLMITKRLARSAQMEVSTFIRNSKNEYLSAEAQHILNQIDTKKLYMKYVWIQDESNQFQMDHNKNEKKQNENINLKASIESHSHKKIHKKLQNWQKQKQLQKEEDKFSLKRLQNKCKGIINRKYNFDEQIFPKTPKNKSFSRTKHKKSASSHRSALNMNSLRKDKSKVQKNTSKSRNGNGNSSKNVVSGKNLKNHYENFLDEALRQTPKEHYHKDKKMFTKKPKKNKSSSFIDIRKNQTISTKKLEQIKMTKKVDKNSSRTSISSKKLIVHKQIPSSPSPKNIGIKSKGKLHMQTSIKKPKKQTQNCYQEYFS